MPRIPGIEHRVQSAGPTNIGQASPADFGAASGRGLQALGQEITELGGYLKDTYDTAIASNASVKAQRDVQDLTLRIQNGYTDEESGEFVPPPRPEEHEAVFKQQVEQINKKYGNELNARAYRVFNQEFRAFAMRQEFEVKTHAIDLYKKEARANYDEALAMDSTNFVDGTELTKPQIQERAFSRIDQAVARGVMDAEDGLRRKKKFIQDSHVGSAIKMIEADPDAFVAAAKRGEYDQLEVDVRERLLKSARDESDRRITRDNRIAEQEERKRKQAQTELEEKTGKQIDKLRHENKLSVEWVYQNEKSMSKEDFHRALNMATGRDDVKSDPTLYADLRNDAGRGKDVRVEATNAYKSGRLEKADYERIVGEVEANSPQAKANNWYTRGVKYLDDALIPIPDAASGFERLTAARSKDDFLNWAAAHPEATPEQAMAEAEKLAEEGRATLLNNLSVTQRIPRFLEKGRKGMVGDDAYENLAKARAATKQALDEKEIDQYEYNRQILILDQAIRTVPKKVKKKTETK